MKKILFILLFLFLQSQVIYPQENIPGNTAETYSSSLDSLVLSLKKRGFDIKPFLSNQNFKIYTGIDSVFINSPEKKGKNAYWEPLKKGDMKKYEEIFSQEYEKYKIQIGLCYKQEKLPGFITEYSDKLSEAEKKYGIPGKIIAAVIGMESDFGKRKNSYYAFNVFVSMYVKNYRRQFAYNQLIELLKFSAKTNKDIFELDSSYAGAVGYMQFMPYSLNKWFIGESLQDMNSNIMSVGNYLSYFKKKKGSIEKAVYSYNPSRLYVKAVYDIAAAGDSLDSR